MSGSGTGRVLAAATAVLVLVGGARAADVCSGRPLALGIGIAQSCEAYLGAEAQTRAVTDAWVLGAISGANLYAPKFNAVGAGLTPQQTLDHVAHVCRIMPARPVADAVAVYLREMTRDCTGAPANRSSATPETSSRIERRA